MSTFQMELEGHDVTFNTLVNQTREFTTVTRDRVDDISVQIEEPNNHALVDIPVQDRGNGRYTFSYRPSSTGNYQVIVKVNGDNIQGSPFTWGVEQWHLVGRDSGIEDLDFSPDNMTVHRIGSGDSDDVVGSCGFSAGRHSWKVMLISGGMSVGVTNCDVSPANQGPDNKWYWCHGSRNREVDGEYTEQSSNIPEFTDGDVCIMFLDHHNKQMTLHHLQSGQRDTWEGFTGQNENVYPYFCPAADSKMTLLC